MLDYETLDAIADAYTPLLGGLWLLLAVSPLPRGQWRLAALRIALGLTTLVVCYGLMFADKALGIWPALGLDYSTHSAVAIAAVGILGTLLPRLRPTWIASLLAYFALMLYQRYHSLADIATTAAVIAPPVVWLCMRFAPHVAPIGHRQPAPQP
ncbi:hypothetical protein [Niveibacterium sp.]|uniref:hypothetical protein n=1 Tax=Niveibacterium sp. TaxID=2017444 RepID=UPI0035B04CBC